MVAAGAGGAAGRPPATKKNDGDNDNQEGAGIACALAGLTRAFVFAVKGGLRKGLVKALLRKKAFLTIGQRTASATLSDHLVSEKATLGGKQKHGSSSSSLGSKSAGRYSIRCEQSIDQEQQIDSLADFSNLVHAFSASSHQKWSAGPCSLRNLRCCGFSNLAAAEGLDNPKDEYQAVSSSLDC